MASSIINAVRSVVGAQPAHRRLAEDATQTFLEGVPCTFNTSTGGVNEWNGTSYTGAIVGVSKEGASNLTTVGVPKTLTYGSVPYQPGAVKIPMGAPLNDGRIGLDISDTNTIFAGQVGPSQTTATTDIGKSYGLTKDSDNRWYVDKNKTTTSGSGSSNQAVVEVVALDQFDVTRGVRFRFLAAASQFIA